MLYAYYIYFILFSIILYIVDIWALGCIMAEMLDGKALFPGTSDIHQLELIQKAIGPLTSSQTKILFNNGKTTSSTPKLQFIYGIYILYIFFIYVYINFIL